MTNMEKSDIHSHLLCVWLEKIYKEHKICNLCFFLQILFSSYWLCCKISFFVALYALLHGKIWTKMMSVEKKWGIWGICSHLRLLAIKTNGLWHKQSLMHLSGCSQNQTEIQKARNLLKFLFLHPDRLILYYIWDLQQSKSE